MSAFLLRVRHTNQEQTDVWTFYLVHAPNLVSAKQKILDRVPDVIAIINHTML